MEDHKFSCLNFHDGDSLLKPTLDLKKAKPEEVFCVQC